MAWKPKRLRKIGKLSIGDTIYVANFDGDDDFDYYGNYMICVKCTVYNVTHHGITIRYKTRSMDNEDFKVINVSDEIYEDLPVCYCGNGLIISRDATSLYAFLSSLLHRATSWNTLKIMNFLEPIKKADSISITQHDED